MEFIITIRNLIKRPFLNIIKVIGLSLALSGIVLIILFLKNELSYDNFHKNSERIFRFNTSSPDFFEGKQFARVFNPGYIPDMTKTIPGIETYVRLVPVFGGVIKHSEDFIKVNEAFQCDSTFFRMFDAVLLVGNPASILDNPGSMVLSESFAKNIFGSNNPIGQVLTIPGGQFYGKNMDFTVLGIMKDFPQNSHFHPEFIATPVDRTEFNRWAWTYLLLEENVRPDDIISGFKKIYSLQNEDEATETEAHLQKITDIHLHSDKLREIEPNSNMSVIYTLSIAAILLLFIAIANYINLNIGMAAFSKKYLNVSKVFGCSRWMNLKYYLYEGILIAIASIAISTSITIYANVLIIKYFNIDLFKGNSLFVLIIVLLFSILSILSGILLLVKEGISRIKSFIDYQPHTRKRHGISRSLILMQYTISTALIVSVLVIQRQTSYALNNSMGVQNSNLLCFENVHSDVQKKFGTFKNELLKYNTIQEVSAMLDPPGGEANDMFRFTLEGYQKNETNKADNMIGILPCDFSVASIFELKFLAGNNFSEWNDDNDGSGEYIINSSALKRLNYSDPKDIIGKEFSLYFEGVKIPKGKIIGVVEDFHLSGIKKKVEPLVLFKRKEEWLINFVISIKQGAKTRGLSDIETVWRKVYPGHPFNFQYVNSIYRNVYQTEILQSGLLSIFTLISLFISSMGLLGMSLLSTQRRTKEIGTRVVNGASAGGIILMLNWDFMKWILISIILAIPVSYLAMTMWLENFAYRINLTWWIFALSGIISLMVALITISVQTWKTANRNPVESLRYE